jgi:hypothetical protein
VRLALGVIAGRIVISGHIRSWSNWNIFNWELELTASRLETILPNSRLYMFRLLCSSGTTHMRRISIWGCAGHEVLLVCFRVTSIGLQCLVRVRNTWAVKMASWRLGSCCDGNQHQHQNSISNRFIFGIGPTNLGSAKHGLHPTVCCQ